MNAVSGPKYCNQAEGEWPESHLLKCMQFDIDYTEKEFIGAFGVESEVQCLDACKATPECKYWTYTTEGKQINSADSLPVIKYTFNRV